MVDTLIGFGTKCLAGAVRQNITSTDNTKASKFQNLMHKPKFLNFSKEKQTMFMMSYV